MPDPTLDIVDANGNPVDENASAWDGSTTSTAPDVNVVDASGNPVNEAASAWDSQYQGYYAGLLGDAFNAAGLSDSSSSIAKEIMAKFSGPTASDKAPAEEGLVDRVKKSIGTGLDWIEKNPKASQLLLGAVGGAYQAAEKKKAAAQLVQDEKDKIAANSASLTGLRPVKRGLINQPLTRIGGAKVFNSAGRI